MSDPRPPKAERDELAEKILLWVSTRLHKGVGPAWGRIDLKVAMTTGVDDFVYVTLNRDGSVQERELPLEEIRRAFRDLRDMHYDEDKGTWFSARFQMHPPDYYRASFNFDIDPVWDPPIPGEEWIKDLEAYPRTGNWTPRWLQAQLNPGVELPRVSPGGPNDHVMYSKQVSLQIRWTLPPGWTYAQVQFREIGGHTEVNGLVRDVAGQMFQWSPPQAVADRFRELRDSTSGGPTAWYSSRFEVEYDSGKEKLTTNRTDEPQWISPPPAEAYQEELRRAGSLDVLPDWLRAQLDQA